MPHKQKIMEIWNELKALQNYVRTTPRKKVLCHIDIHGWNVKMNTRGEVVLLDLEGMMLAPPEADLQAFGDYFEESVISYGDELVKHQNMLELLTQLDAKFFGFYDFRRNLADLTDWMVSLSNTTLINKLDSNSI